MNKIDANLNPLTQIIPDVQVKNDFWGRMTVTFKGDKIPLAAFYKTILTRALRDAVEKEQLAPGNPAALSQTLQKLKQCEHTFKASRQKIENGFIYKYLAPSFFKNWKREQWNEIENNYREAKKTLIALKEEYETVNQIKASFGRFDKKASKAEAGIKTHSPQIKYIEKLKAARAQITALAANYDQKNAPYIGEKAAAVLNDQSQQLTDRIDQDILLLKQVQKMQEVLGPEQLNIESVRSECISLLGERPLNVSDPQSLYADLMQRIQNGRISERERGEGLDALYSGKWGTADSPWKPGNSPADRLISRIEERANDLRELQSRLRSLIEQLNSQDDPEMLLLSLKQRLVSIDEMLDDEIQNHHSEMENIHNHLFMLPAGVRFDPNQRTLNSNISRGWNSNAPWKVVNHVLEPAKRYVQEHQASEDPSTVLSVKWTHTLIAKLEDALAAVAQEKGQRQSFVSQVQQTIDEVVKRIQTAAGPEDATDVELRCGDKSLKLHKAMLARLEEKFPGYFGPMFLEGFKEAQHGQLEKQVIELSPDLPWDGVVQFVGWMYGVVDLNKSAPGWLSSDFQIVKDYFLPARKAKDSRGVLSESPPPPANLTGYPVEELDALADLQIPCGEDGKQRFPMHRVFMERIVKEAALTEGDQALLSDLTGLPADHALLLKAILYGKGEEFTTSPAILLQIVIYLSNRGASEKLMGLICHKGRTKVNPEDPQSIIDAIRLYRELKYSVSPDQRKEKISEAAKQLAAWMTSRSGHQPALDLSGFETLTLRREISPKEPNGKPFTEEEWNHLVNNLGRLKFSGKLDLSQIQMTEKRLLKLIQAGFPPGQITGLGNKLGPHIEALCAGRRPQELPTITPLVAYLVANSNDFLLKRMLVRNLAKPQPALDSDVLDILANDPVIARHLEEINLQDSPLLDRKEWKKLAEAFPNLKILNVKLPPMAPVLGPGFQPGKMEPLGPVETEGFWVQILPRFKNLQKLTFINRMPPDALTITTIAEKLTHLQQILVSELPQGMTEEDLYQLSVRQGLKILPTQQAGILSKRTFEFLSEIFENANKDGRPFSPLERHLLARAPREAAKKSFAGGLLDDSLIDVVLNKLIYEDSKVAPPKRTEKTLPSLMSPQSWFEDALDSFLTSQEAVAGRISWGGLLDVLLPFSKEIPMSDLLSLTESRLEKLKLRAPGDGLASTLLSLLDSRVQSKQLQFTELSAELQKVLLDYVEPEVELELVKKHGGAKDPTPIADVYLEHFMGIDDELLSLPFRIERTLTALEQYNRQPQPSLASLVAAIERGVKELDQHLLPETPAQGQDPMAGARERWEAFVRQASEQSGRIFLDLASDRDSKKRLEEGLKTLGIAFGREIPLELDTKRAELEDEAIMQYLMRHNQVEYESVRNHLNSYMARNPQATVDEALRKFRGG